MADVSVIIPVYNAEKTLRKCVESIVLGERRDVEVILVEDHAADESWELCQALSRQFPNIRVLRNDRNRGVSHTRNQGLDAAAGEYICFVDSDDWVSARYLGTLLEAARAHPDTLTLCGLHYINTVEDFRRTFLWNGDPRVEKEDFFRLHSSFLLPQLWNKIFRRDVIFRHKLRFDESISMGEDFQFVLDYLQAARIHRCTVCDQPLYYYTRTRSDTLMSHFGDQQRELEFARYARLRDLTGAEDAYLQAVESLKGNFIYHQLRHSKLPKAEQLARIEAIAADGRAMQHYKNLQTVRRKEAVVLALRKLRNDLALRWGDLQRRRNRRIIEKVRAALPQPMPAITLISQNCIGGIFYQDMGMRFDSPTVGLFFKGPDFVKLASDLPGYMAMEPEMRWDEEYPVGKLGDIEIHFMHYDTCAKALQAWRRRRERIHWDHILVLCSDRDGFTAEDFAKWTEIPYPKVLFTGNDAYRSHPDSLYFKEYRRAGMAGDLIPHRKFYRSGKLIQMIKRGSK